MHVYLYYICMYTCTVEVFIMINIQYILSQINQHILVLVSVDKMLRNFDMFYFSLNESALNSLQEYLQYSKYLKRQLQKHI